MTFVLDEALAKAATDVTALRLCRILLMRDRNYPWILLVPQRADIREIHQLAPEDRALLTEEIAVASRAMEEIYRPHKLNVAALGNITPQLHVHVIARYRTDPAWPKPVWGAVGPAHYPIADLAKAKARLRAAFAGAIA